MENQQPINRIFCAFPIFCPSESMFKRNLLSVISFVEYIRLNPSYLDGSKGFILDIFYGGWSLKDEWFNDIKNYIKNTLPEILDGNGKPINFVKVFRFEKNYGKAKIVNDLAMDYDVLRPGTQFMYTCDSDIKMMNSQIHFFERLVLSARCIEQVIEQSTGVKKPFGMVALNQGSEANYHWFEPRDGYTGLDQTASYEVNGENGLKMTETICWPSDGAGIAGGSYFANFLLFKHVGGYRKLNSPYNSDDGMWLRDVIQSGSIAMVIKSLSVLHPLPEDSDQYLEYKKESMKSAFESYDENKFNKNVEESEKIFGNYE